MKTQARQSFLIGAALLAGCASTTTYVDVYKVAWDIHPANDSAKTSGFRKLYSRSYRHQPPTEVVLYGLAGNDVRKVDMILTVREVSPGDEWGQILKAAGDIAGITATSGVSTSAKPKKKFVRRSLVGELATGEMVNCEFEQVEHVDYDVVMPGAFFAAFDLEDKSERLIGSARVDLGGCRFSNGDVFKVRQESSMVKEAVE